MPDPVWPATLPSPRVEFSGTTNHSVARTQMETGRVRQRRRFMARQKMWKFEIMLTEAQYLEFQEFVDDDLDGGANYFTLDIIDSSGIETKTVRMIGGEFGFRQLPPDMWAVELNVEESYIY